MQNRDMHFIKYDCPKKMRVLEELGMEKKGQKEVQVGFPTLLSTYVSIQRGSAGMSRSPFFFGKICNPRYTQSTEINDNM